MYVLDLEVVPHHCRYPPVPNSVQIGHRQDIGQWVIVGSNEEGLVLQILPKLFGHGPFQGQELQFRRVVLQVASLEAVTGIGYWVITAIILLLGEHGPQALYRCMSVSSRKGFLKSVNANTGAVRHFILSSWNATRASGGSPTGWDLSLLFSPWSRSFNSLVILVYPLMKRWKYPMAPKNLRTWVYVAGGAISSDAFQTFSAQFHSSHRYFVPKIVDLCVEEITFGWL